MRWCASLCIATNKKMVTFLFWTATKTNYKSKCSDFQKKLIDTITTSNFYLKLKKTMKMTWLHKFFGLFFNPADGRAKSVQQLISTVLPFHPLYFPWFASSWFNFLHCEIGTCLVTVGLLWCQEHAFFVKKGLRGNFPPSFYFFPLCFVPNLRLTSAKSNE